MVWLKRIIINIKWYPSSLYNRLIFKLRKIPTGIGLVTYGALFIRGTGKIIIGNNVRINSCRETNPIGGDIKTILFAKENGVIIIGNNVGISNSAIVCMENITIEDDVMIGANCKVYDHDFHSLKLKERMQFPDPGVKSSAILIKQGAFIGAHSIILKGVTIGKESIIGSGSVVTKSVPDREIWGGNPAKFIRRID